jgi:two-component system CheB/CheR fusion protein
MALGQDNGHATTAHRRVHRPQSSLRLGLTSYSGRGRSFLSTNQSFVVSHARPIVAVIEADATDRRMLCSLLSRLNADVQDYDSAESYLASSDGNRGGCLITDMTLPGMSGLELLRQLRARHASTPVILLGEDADVRAAVAAMREGAVDFIEKTHVDFSIVRRVAYLLDHSQHAAH